MSLQRRQQQEEAKQRKEQEAQTRRDREKAKDEERQRKKEEQAQRRAVILEQYKLKKAIEEAEREVIYYTSAQYLNYLLVKKLIILFEAILLSDSLFKLLSG